MHARERYDVIVVGAGAGGLAVTYRLVMAGLSVLLLEKGYPLPRDGSTLSVNKVMSLGTFKSKERWSDARGRPLVPEEYFNVGGKTKWYGAALIRFSPDEFKPEHSRSCLAWPIGYEVLAPYYEIAEELLGARTFSIEPQLAALLARVSQRAPEWRHQPLSLGLDPRILENPDEAKHFDGFASAKGLKFDAERAFLDRVRQQPNLVMITGKNVIALRCRTDRPEQVSGVRCQDGSEFAATNVILAAGALHSCRLLERYLRITGLKSKLPGAELVGRYYKCHLNSALVAVSRCRKTDLLRKTALLQNDRFPFSSVQTLGWIDREILGSQLPPLTRSLVAGPLGKRAYGFWLTTEDGSHPDNRISAPEEANPMIDYDTRRLPQAEKEHQQLTRALLLLLARVGYLGFAKRMPLAATGHACGTLVTGRDPANSVVDSAGRVHGLENLYVADGSVLPRSSRVNPSLTIYAWALRVGDLIARDAA